MVNAPLNIAEFIKLTGHFPVIDVRSPGEFLQGHIPGAYNIPLFDNEERAKVGTAYKQIGREKAIEIGYQVVNPKLKSFIDRVQAILSQKLEASNVKPETVLIHCWRGGMRSAGFAGFLNEHGFKTHTLVRGYKAYRNHVLENFETISELLIIGGETGSGKTEILRNIAQTGEQIVDLERLANHKGSAFGALGEKAQPTQEQFENELSSAFSAIDLTKRIWIEDESRSIGKCQLPAPLWEKMKQAPILRINFPKALRIERLMSDYGNFSKEELASCIQKISKRLGPNHTKHALEELDGGNLREVADITLIYYDKAYNYNHEKRNMKDVFFIESETADPSLNAEKMLTFANQKLKHANA